MYKRGFQVIVLETCDKQLFITLEDALEFCDELDGNHAIIFEAIKDTNKSDWHYIRFVLIYAKSLVIKLKD